MSEIDTTQLLPMSVVLGEGNIEPSKEILYADYIDKEKVISAFNSLSELGSEGGICNTTSELISTNDSLMSQTNSSRFYTGTQAKKKFGNMETIRSRFSDIASYINGSEELELIKKGIDDYNKKLTKLKNNCRKKMLEKTADDFNALNKEYDGFPTKKEYKDEGWINGDHPAYDEAFNNCAGDNVTEYDYEVVDTRSTKKEYKDDQGFVYHTEYTYYYTYEIHKYKKVTYWNFFKNWDPFHLDPDVFELEALLTQVGATIPYDPALVVEFDVN